MFRQIAAATVLVLLSGCFTHYWERFTWQEPNSTFDAFPDEGTSGGWQISYHRMAEGDRRSAAGTVLDSLPLSPAAVGNRWGHEYALTAVQHGDLRLQYSGWGIERNPDGSPVDDRGLGTIFVVKDRPTTLEAARAEFVDFALNVSTADREEAVRWSWNALPEEDRVKISTVTTANGYFEYSASAWIEHPLRLDGLAREHDLQNLTPIRAGAYEHDGWTWEFSFTQARATREGSSGSTVLEIDSSGFAYFGRNSGRPIGEENLESEAKALFAALGLPPPTFKDRVYLSDSFKGD